MRGALCLAATVAATLAAGWPAAAQNSAQSPPPRADAISGSTPEGDPNGAVRALGQADGNDDSRKPSVSVPKLGGEGPNRTGGLPAGTR